MKPKPTNQPTSVLHMHAHAPPHTHILCRSLSVSCLSVCLSVSLSLYIYINGAMGQLSSELHKNENNTDFSLSQIY